MIYYFDDRSLLSVVKLNHSVLFTYSEYFSHSSITLLFSRLCVRVASGLLLSDLLPNVSCIFCFPCTCYMSAETVAQIIGFLFKIFIL
jgi:hypothetical protein